MRDRQEYVEQTPTDGLGLFHDETTVIDRIDDDYVDEQELRRRKKKAALEKKRIKTKRRNRMVLISVLLVGILGAASFAAYTLFWYSDYKGDGTGSVVVQVEDGSSLTAIGKTLEKAGVVASAKAFTKNVGAANIVPGSYKLHKEMSGAAAVALMQNPSSKVGSFDVKGGEQLFDFKVSEKETKPGIYSKIAEASCTEESGTKKCVSVDELKSVASTGDPADLGAPEWAVASIKKAPDQKRRLEGLILPGTYNVPPGLSAKDTLKNVMQTSMAIMTKAGMPDLANKTGLTPYQVLTLASLVERESNTEDMPKISRVIYNRMASDEPPMQRLQLDSTVNYLLDRQHIRTSDADRNNKQNPYNTYQQKGLTPTPIGSPGLNALKAAANPEPGKWLFFVVCEKPDKSCFAETFAEHDRLQADAQRRGIF
ncbi:endolytic transglycosylase MltG [Pseudonocardiaceae bacterium YIM PH 21723]|nr:endolytic transglycosylase MltG [Pseudonocardiaceae bacterium YIM PH 21723]